jgi:hypothetical protein
LSEARERFGDGDLDNDRLRPRSDATRFAAAEKRTDLVAEKSAVTTESINGEGGTSNG